MAKTTKPLPRMRAWSYSRYKDYSTCPFKSKLKHIDGLKEPGNKAMERGSHIHKLAEDFVKLKQKTLPEELKMFAREFKKLQKLDTRTEDRWAFDMNWVPCEFFDSNTWLRMVADAQHVKVLKSDEERMTVIDYKTGRIYGDNQDQMQLYAVGVFHRFPAVQKVKVELWYIDSGDIIELEFNRSQAEELRQQWEERIKPMMTDTQFAPRPNRFCAKCHFRKANGGPCEF